MLTYICIYIYIYIYTKFEVVSIFSKKYTIVLSFNLLFIYIENYIGSYKGIKNKNL